MYRSILRVLYQGLSGEVSRSVETHVFQEVGKTALVVLFLYGAYFLGNVEVGAVSRKTVFTNVIGQYSGCYRLLSADSSRLEQRPYSGSQRNRQGTRRYQWRMAYPHECHATFSGENASRHVCRNKIRQLLPYRNHGRCNELQASDFTRLLWKMVPLDT